MSSNIRHVEPYAQSPDPRPSFRSFALPPSPTPLPRYSSLPAQIELKPEIEQIGTFPQTSCGNNFTDRRAGMPAPRANSWAGEINRKAASDARLTALEDSSVGSGRIFVGFGFLFTSM
ncbi:uncharacterized protein RSE6_04629 [Rhynchosporium secalis]|uniref:Uncharacterized protein n=1 Tax=Rhynchosporium secalis TaxID=38038 RepID=A0A1E1M5V1_RHYSE|nr:uncharacterized protein RSE6_04629 [Rhynchosporium secalis]